MPRLLDRAFLERYDEPIIVRSNRSSARDAWLTDGTFCAWCHVAQWRSPVSTKPLHCSSSMSITVPNRAAKASRSSSRTSEREGGHSPPRRPTRSSCGTVMVARKVRGSVGDEAMTTRWYLTNRDRLLGAVFLRLIRSRSGGHSAFVVGRSAREHRCRRMSTKG